MNNNSLDVIQEHALLWAEQLQDDPAFTVSDIAELKSHYIDLTEDLTTQGLRVEDAILVASSRLNINSTLRNAFEEVNMPINQLRKTIQVLSGILLYFLQYYFLIFSSRLLVFVLTELIDDPYLPIRYVFSYVITYHLIFVIATIILYFNGEKILRNKDFLKFGPSKAILLFLGVLTLELAEQWFRYLIADKFEPGSYTYIRLSSLFEYIAYSYPLLLGICFMFLIKKHFSSVTLRENMPPTVTKMTSCPGNSNIEMSEDRSSDSIDKNQLERHVEELDKILGDTEEAITIAQMRLKMNPQNDHLPSKSRRNPMRNLIIVLSGVLVYYFLYYLMISSASGVFFILQFIKKDVALNISRTFSYVMTFQMFFILFITSVYFLNKNIVNWLNRFHLKIVHTRWLLVATIFLALVYRCFYAISMNVIRIDQGDLEYKFFDIFIVSGYTFPLILGVSFLILFYKYYYDNVKSI